MVLAQKICKFVTGVSVLFGVSLTIANDAQAYVTKETPNGSTIRWFKGEEGEIPFRIDPSVEMIASMEDFEEAFYIASSAWAGLGGVPEIVLDEGPAKNIHQGDVGENVISVPEQWPGAANQLAITITTYDVGSGEIVDTDIMFNPDHLILFIRQQQSRPTQNQFQKTPSLSEKMAFDLAAVMTHEVGHSLGLDESDHEKATMWCKIQPGQTYQRLIHDDDIEGVREVYEEEPGDSSLNGPLAQAQCQISTPTSNRSNHFIIAFFLAACAGVVLRRKVFYMNSR